jgi:hypothetical protein
MTSGFPLGFSQGGNPRLTLPRVDGSSGSGRSYPTQGRGRVTTSALTTDRPTTEGMYMSRQTVFQPTRPRELGREYTEKLLILLFESAR